MVGHTRRFGEIEIEILPFDDRMASDRENGKGWLQWAPEECWTIPGWVYCLLGLAWPILRLVWRLPIDGRPTDYLRVR